MIAVGGSETSGFRSLTTLAVQPQRPPVALSWCVFVVSAAAMLLAGFVGSMGAMVFLVLWVMLGGAYAPASLSLLRDTPTLPWVLAAFTMASVFWSQAPIDTFKFGLEYVATVGCSLLAAAFLRPRQLMSALTAALLLIALLSVILGQHAVDPLTGVDTFVGVFSSKNQLGFFVSLLLLSGIALVIDGGQRLTVRMMGCAAILLALPLLAISHSGTSVVSAGLSSCVLLGNLLLSRLSRFARARLIFALVCVMIPVGGLVIFAGDDMATLLLGALGKDATLTGRTTLWQRAAQLIPSHPLLGIGYQAFWLQNDVNAESLWQEFHILSRGGFHFHSTYIETIIELGFVGAAILVAMVGKLFFDLIRWSWRVRSVPATFFVGLQFCLLTRSFVEVDFLGQFQIGTFMLLIAASYAMHQPEADAP